MLKRWMEKEAPRLDGPLSVLRYSVLLLSTTTTDEGTSVVLKWCKIPRRQFTCISKAVPRQASHTHTHTYKAACLHISLLWSIQASCIL